MTEKQQENEKKKEYLNQYMELKKAIKRLQEQQDIVILNKICPSVSYSGMPGAHNITDISDFSVKVDEFENRIIKLKYQRLKLQGEIFEKVEAMKNENERAVLDYRYLRGMTFEKIAVKLSTPEKDVDVRTIYRWHGNALMNFKL